MEFHISTLYEHTQIHAFLYFFFTFYTFDL